MNPQIQRNFDQVERQRADLKSEVLKLTEKQLDWKSTTAFWSIRQIIEHLVRSSDSVKRAITTGKMEKELPIARLIPQPIRFSLILGALNNDRVLPVPSEALMPTGNDSVQTMFIQWDVIMDELRKALEPLNQEDKRYTHPALGPLTILQTLELGRVHSAYHIRQIERISKSQEVGERR